MSDYKVMALPYLLLVNFGKNCELKDENILKEDQFKFNVKLATSDINIYL